MLGQHQLQEGALQVPPPRVRGGFSSPGRCQGKGLHNNPWASLQVVEEEKEEEKNTVQKNTKKNHKIQKQKKSIKQKTTNEIENPQKKKRGKIKYRGKGGRNERNKRCDILLVNMRGFKSKKESLSRILDNIKPDVVAINETQLKGKVKVEMDGYKSWTRNRVGQGGGGVATSVALKHQDMVVGAGEGEQEEYLVTRMEGFSPALTIVNCYGEQRKTGKEEVEEKWKRMLRVMEEIRARGELCLLCGDLNKHVGNDELGIPGNHPDISPGGRLLRELLSTGNWVLVNGMGEEVVVGGPYTREDPATGGLTALDMFIVSRELRPHVTSLVIDSERKFTPSRVVKRKGEAKQVYTDHYSALLTLTNLARGKDMMEGKQLRWNLAKEGGWSRYKELTDEYAEKIEKAVTSPENTVEEAMTKFERIHDKIKFRAFGKVTLRDRRDDSSETKPIKETNADEMFEEEAKRVEAELDDIKKNHNGRVGKVWEVRRRIMGSNKAPNETTAILNPETKKLAVNKAEIKEATLKYCKATLENNPPEERYKESIKEKKDKVKERMEESDGNFNISEELFEEVVAKFKRSKKRNYDFITRAGKKFQNSVFMFCSRMIKEEQFPRCFQDTILHMMFKGGKGRREVLSDNRFIHSKSWLPRTVEALVVMGGLREPLVDGSTKFQVGGQPGHRVEELIFVMKSTIAKYRSERKQVILQCFDLEKYFDKENIEDAILTCYNRGADAKAVRCWFKLNQETNIRVRTGVGLSDKALVGAVVGQGTMGGALVSQGVLDDAVQEHFQPGGEEELEYGGVQLAPLMFQDDFLQGTGRLEEARRASEKVNSMLKQRALKLNSRKSVCLVMGTTKQKMEITKQLKQKPLMCGEVEIKEARVEKWLGQYMSAGGLADSVSETIKAKEGKVRGACMEVATIVEDWRSQAIGGIEAAFILWEACCIPTILSGAGNWINMTKAAEQRLESLQNWFVRLILRVGPGCPAASLRWETGLLSMKMRVWIEKLLLVRHIRGLEASTLARQVFEEQMSQKLPGLAREAAAICQTLGLEDCNKVAMERWSNKQYRAMVLDHCRKKDEEELRKMGSGQRKCEMIFKEEYGRKKYMRMRTLKEVRSLFCTRVQMQPFAGNYSKDKRFQNTNWRCLCGEAKEEEEHLRGGECPIYGDIRGEFPVIMDDDQLDDLFTRIIERRKRLEEEEKRGEEVLAADHMTADVASPPGQASL